MAYQGSTGSSHFNPPVVISQPMAGGRYNAKIWQYISTHSNAAISDTTGFFTDGQLLGMKLGELMWASDSSVGNNDWWAFRVTEVTSTGASVSTGILLAT